MKLLKTKINGPIIIKTKIFNDKRGSLKEIFRTDLMKKENSLSVSSPMSGSPALADNAAPEM